VITARKGATGAPWLGATQAGAECRVIENRHFSVAPRGAFLAYRDMTICSFSRENNTGTALVGRTCSVI
jgi:hypothetical protein